MSGGVWRPIGAEGREREALISGVPPWLEESVWGWLDAWSEGLRRPWDKSLGGFVLQFERKLRLTKPIYRYFHYSLSSLRGRLDEQDVLNLIDWCLFCVDDCSYPETLTEMLDRILLEGGSEWRIGTRNGNCGLERRLPEGVREAAESVMAKPNEAGTLLSAAWLSVYGRKPNPTLAYQDAIRAVEASAKPVVCPKDQRAQLGKIADVIRDQKGWQLAFQRAPDGHPAHTVLEGMMRTLAAGHVRRHGGDLSDCEVSQEAAEAAVMLAVCLVEWFSSGAVRRSL